MPKCVVRILKARSTHSVTQEACLSWSQSSQRLEWYHRSSRRPVASSRRCDLQRRRTSHKTFLKASDDALGCSTIDKRYTQYTSIATHDILNQVNRGRSTLFVLQTLISARLSQPEMLLRVDLHAPIRMMHEDIGVELDRAMSLDVPCLDEVSHSKPAGRPTWRPHALR